jgi:methyltransferase (TIGR00027 family)
VEDIDSSFQTLIGMGAKEHTPVTDRLNIRIAKVVDPFGNIIGITGLPLAANKRTVENKPSESASLLTFCRALAAKDEREEIKGPDTLAELFLTEEEKKPLKDSASRKWAIQRLITSPKYGYSISRTAFIDNLLKKSLSENILQIVLLGAGYDSRAYRFHDLLGKTRIFEVDIRATQKRKIDLLKQNKIAIPENITFVTMNFETENLKEVLIKAGFKVGTKTLYIWEGVTYYLTKDTIKKTLNFISKDSSKGSVVCFDYLADKIDSMNAAEPYQWIIDQEELGKLLSEYDLEMTEHIDSKEMEKRYLTLKDGSLAEECIAHFRFVTAMVL